MNTLHTPPILRPYQSEAAHWLSRRERGLIVSPAGSGKTLIMSAAIQHLVNAMIVERVGWMCNTVEQARQAEEAIERVIGRTYCEFRITCAAGKPTFEDCDLLVVDEAHRAVAPSWQEAIATCGGRVWACSATPFNDDVDGHREAMLETFREVYYVDRSQIPKVAARVIMLDATDPGLRAPIDDEIARRMVSQRRWAMCSEQELWARVAYQVCLEIGVQDNHRRNQAIIATANHHVHRDDAVLILVHKIEHGYALSGAIPGSIMCHSKMGRKLRTLAIEKFRTGQCPCIIATTLADEGIDLPRANVLIMAGAGKAAGRVEQRTGRVLRTFAGKAGATIYDFEDRQHPLLASQSRKRQAVYARLGYEMHP